MTCPIRAPKYFPHSEGGVIRAISNKDGYGIALEWTRAYPDTDYTIAYNIYFSTNRDDVFTEAPKFLSLSASDFKIIVQELAAGQTYFFAVRATEYDPTFFNFTLLPESGALKIYPESMLLENISADDLVIPISDIEQFPAFGVIQIGAELMFYSGKDIPNSSLVGITRGFYDSNIRQHDVDGYDGYHMRDPLVYFYKGFEEGNSVIAMETANFAYPNFARTNADGYFTVVKDILTTEMGGSDESFGAVSADNGGTYQASQEALPAYDYAGWHRTDPLLLLKGCCIDTYYGGEQFCADGYAGVGRQIRGVPINVEAARKQEAVLRLTGEPVVLVRRRWTGIRCNCFMPNTEIPDDRCRNCFGHGFVTSFEQFFNPRRSDGKILVRFGPTEDDLTVEEGGFESKFISDCMTMVVPAIKDRDFLIRFNEDGSEEFRYEVLNVTRNKLFYGEYGAQKFRAQRVRKTDHIYRWRAVRDTSTMPTALSTSIGLVPGPGGISPHSHVIMIGSGIVSVSQINGTTSVAAGHNHTVINGVVQIYSDGDLGHSHTIIL